MGMKFTFKGRTFSSARSMADAMNREVKRGVESKIRSAASSSGIQLSKTSGGFELKGTPEQLNRFNQRLGR